MTRTHDETQIDLEALIAQMADKGVINPEASLTQYANSEPYVRIGCDYSHKAFDGRDFKHFRDENIQDALNAARSYINELPDPQETKTREYLRKVASAIDYAKEADIDEEYVAPLRSVTCAMTDNLLTKGDA